MKSLLSFLVFLTLSSAFAQDTLDVTTERLRLDKLSVGSDKYLVYLEHPKKGNFKLSIWERTVEKKMIGGQLMFVLDQVWHADDSTLYREVYSIVDPANFQTVFHRTMRIGTIEAYDFYPDRIVGSDSVGQNSKVGFELATGISPFNWELDIEMLQMLPYENEQDFHILYYHPGSKSEPAYKNYQYLGTEPIALTDNEAKIDCYKVFIDYGKGNSATFWVSTKTRKLLKMEEIFGQIKRYKLKI